MLIRERKIKFMKQLTISHHAVYRFVQRYQRRRVHYKALSMDDYDKAKSTITTMFAHATPQEKDRYIYQNFVLVCKENTIVTVYPKH